MTRHALSLNASVRRRAPIAVPLLGFLIFLGLPGGRALAAESVLDIDTVRNGDLDAQASAWQQTITAAPDSLLTQFYLSRWNQELLNKPTPGPSAARWREVGSTIEKNGWSHRLASWHLFRQLRREGKLDEASELGMDEGSPRRWAGIGPFGQEPATALHRSFPPEQEFDADASYEVFGHEVRWREVESARNDTRVHPNREWRRTAGVFYLRTRFAIDEPFRGILQVGGRASVKVWLDGNEIGTVDRYRNELPQTAYYGVTMAAGEHTLVVKTNAASFSVLLRDVNGFPQPIRGLAPTGASHKTESRADASVVPRGLAVLDWLERWREGTLDRKYWLPLALLAIDYGDPYLGREILLQWEERKLPVVPLALAATRVVDELEYLPQDWRQNWLDRLWEEAAEIDDMVVPLRIAEAASLYSEDRAEESIESIDEILEVQPRSLEALLLREEVCGEREWHAKRRESLDRLRELAPEHPSVLRRWIAHWSGQGRPDLTLPLLETLFRIEPASFNARALARAYRSAGLTEKASAMLERSAELAGSDTDSLTRRFQMLEGWGEYEKALEAVTELVRRNPGDDRYHNAAANLAWHLEQYPVALEHYRRSLELTPGELSVARRIEHLEQLLGEVEKPTPFWAPYARSADEAIRNAPPRGKYPQASAVYLIDQMVTSVVAGRGVEEMIHQVARLDSAQAVEEFSELSVPGEVLEVRVITADGTELHPTSGSTGGNFTLPGLTPGAIVEYRCITRRGLRSEEFLRLGPFYFQDPNFTSAFHLTEWIVLLPEAWTPNIRERNLPFERQERLVDGVRELTWLAQEMPRPQPEQLAPPADRVLPNVIVWSPVDWSRALETITPTHASDDTPSPELRRAVASILEGITDPEAKIKALYDAACERVTIDFGGENASEIWLSRSGDRDLLLAGLLRTAGIPYLEVLAAEKDALAPYRDWSVPNPDVFQYSFLRVELDDRPPLYLSARFRLAQMGRIPAAFQGGRAVMVRPWGVEWTSLPQADPLREAQKMETLIDLTQDLAQVEGFMEQRQLAASSLKERLKDITETQRDQAIQGFVGQVLPGASVLSGGFPRVAEPGAPFRIEFASESSRLLQRSAEGPVLSPVFYPTQLRARFARDSKRRYPLVSGVEVITMERTVVQLGDRFEATRLPESVDLCGAWGTYQFRVETRGTEVVVERQLRLQPFVLPPEQVQDFTTTCAQIDRKEEERILLKDKSGA